MTRRVTFTVEIDLAKGSKEAHASTIRNIGHNVGLYATQNMEANGYSVHRSKAYTTLHYVRHRLTHVIKQPKRLRIVRSADR